MLLFHHYHLNLRRAIHSDFWLFELSIWLHVFARSLIAVFVPIMLLRIGYTIPNVILFLFLLCLIDFPFNFVAQWLVRTIGARWVMVCAMLATIGFFLVLYGLGPNDWNSMLTLATLGALYDAFFWVAHLYLFIGTNKKKDNTAEKTGILYMVRQLGGVLGPAIGAVILLIAGKDALILVSVVILGFSILPLLKLKADHDKPKKTTVANFRRYFAHLTEKKNYIASALQSIHAQTEANLWPLFIFATIGTVESVAAVPIIVSITAILFSYLAGKLSAREGEKMIVVGSALIAIIWVLRLQTDSTVFYYVSIFLIGLFSLLVTIPLDSNIFERAKILDPLSGSTYRNATRVLVNACFYGSLLLIINIFRASFLTATVSVFVLMVVSFIFLRYTTKLNTKQPAA